MTASDLQALVQIGAICLFVVAVVNMVAIIVERMGDQ